MEISLTNREADLMEVLWERGASTVSEVRDFLNDELAYTTVLTILRTLEDKGYVDHREEGRAHRYRPTVSRDVARKSALKALSHKLFKGSTELLLTHLVTDEKLTDDEILRIRRLLDRPAKGRES
jgi:predicted transcriptional regulator